MLKEVELANNGKRVFDPWVLKYLLNELESSPDNPIDFPFNVSGHDGVESIVTMEDGRVEKQVTGRGWSWKYENNKLREKITYADLGQNRLPVKVERGFPKGDSITGSFAEPQLSDADGWVTSDIAYNDDMQVSLMQGHLKDKSWTKEAMDTHAPYAPPTSDYNMLTRNTAVYYNAQRLVAKVNDYGTEKTFVYDPKGNLIQVDESSTLYKTTKYTYNENGDLTKVEYPDGKVNEMAYSAGGLVTEVKNNDGTKTTIERNERGEVIGIIDEENRKVELTWDVMGRVTKEKSPSGREVSYQWGGAGCSSCGDGSKLVKITDAGGNNWEFKYDLIGNPIEMVYPDTTKISQEYDIAGRLTAFTNKRGQEIAYTYDTDGKLITKTTLEGDTDFTYDDRERIIEIQAADFDYKYSYGVVDGGWLGVVGNSIVVKEEMSPAGIASLDASEDLGIVMLWTETLTNYHGLPRETFDNFGWHKLFTYDFATTPVAYAPVQILYGKRYIEYDKLTINNSYDNGLRIYKKTNSRFNNETFHYFDANGFMNGILYRAISGYTGCWPTGKLNFARDNSGLISQITEDLAMTADYNPDLEISSVNHTVPQSFDEVYTYDSRGNRLTDLTKTYLYDNLNKLIDSTTHLYGYDLDGNLTLEKNKLTSETKKYYWDSENMLIKYEHQATDISPIDITATYKYDIYGRRIQKSVNGTITNFMWEGDNLSMELDASNQPIKKYFIELGMDDYFGQLEYSEVTNWSKIFDYSYPQGWYGYIKDQVGNIYRVWDRNLKQYAETRIYDTFGNLINQTGTTKTNLGFQGKYYDTETGLNYFYHRYYSPSIGRFISEDPIGLNGGVNLFKYVGDNPINSIDPTGNITDFNYFPEPYYDRKTNKNPNVVTIWDYIGWTSSGVADDIKKVAVGVWKSVIGYNWCCFATCISEDKEILDTLSKQIFFNIMVSAVWTFQPDFAAIWFVLPEWKLTSNALNMVLVAQVAKKISKCYEICKK